MNKDINYRVGSKIRFSEDPLPYSVMASDERYMVCTRKLNRRKDADILWKEVEVNAFLSFSEAYNSLKNDPVYTIVDLEESIRGTENLIFGMGFGSKKKCREAITRLRNNESEISYKNRISLNIGH